MGLLSDIRSPKDVRAMTPGQMPELAEEIRG